MKHSRTQTNRRTPPKARAVIIILISLLLVSWNYQVQADLAPGDLDPAFGSEGKVITDFVVNGATRNAKLSALALQPDGKIVAAGPTGFSGLALARYTPDGRLDATFGDGGKVVSEAVGDYYFGPFLVGILPGGRILVASDLFPLLPPGGSFLSCYTPDGNLDTSFGDGGKVYDPSIAVSDLVVQADGRVVIATVNKGLIRINPDGTRDRSFGADGQAAIDGVRVYKLTQQSDGQIVGAGSADNLGFALARYNPDGRLDPLFGKKGVVRTDMPGGEGALRVALATDGRIVALGRSREGGKKQPYRLALVRYNTDGSLDSSFGDAGKITTLCSESYPNPTGLAVQPDGHILVSKSSGDDGDFELIRYTPNGSLDLLFGSAGVMRTDFSGRRDEISALALVSHDRVVAAGSSGLLDATGTPQESCFALACYAATVTPQEADFDLGFSPSVIHATRGTKVIVEVSLYRMGGFSGAVTITPPAPAIEGIICKSPEPLTTTGIAASWSFKVKGSAAPGPHQLTFVGRDATGSERSATVTLLVD